MQGEEQQNTPKKQLSSTDIATYGIGIDVDNLDTKKRDMLLALTKTLGIVSQACTMCKISRQTYYNWINDDKEFSEAVSALDDYQKDFVESKLLKKIQEEDLTAIIFFAKTKMKDRGYVERTEIAPISQPRTTVYYPEVQDISHYEMPADADNKDE